MAYLLGLIASMILPTLVFVYTLKKSKRHRYSMGSIIGMVFYGIGVVALLGFGVLMLVYAIFPDIEEYPFIMWYVRAAGLEEFFKFLFVYLLFWKRNKLRYNWDIMIAMVATGWGFTFAENIEYVLMTGNPLMVGIMRGLHFGHIDFSIIMGFFMIKAANAEAVDQAGKRTWYFFLSVLTAILYHGTYDYAVSEFGGFGIVFFGIFILMCIPLFLWLRTMMKDYWLLFPEHDPVMPQMMQPGQMNPQMYQPNHMGQPMAQQAYQQPGQMGQPMNPQMYQPNRMGQPMAQQVYQQPGQMGQQAMNPQMYQQNRMGQPMAQQVYQQPGQMGQQAMNPQMYQPNGMPQQQANPSAGYQNMQKVQQQAAPIRVETIQVQHRQ